MRKSNSPEDRLAINNYDFSHPDFFIGNKDTPWDAGARRSKVTVRRAGHR